MADIPPPPPPPEGLSWLILGGCGFIGTNLIQLLDRLDICSKITVADLKPPNRCPLPPNVLSLYQNKKIDFIQSDLCQDAHVTRLFGTPEQPRCYDIVVDLMAETRVEKFNQDVLIAKTTKPTQQIIEKLTQIANDPTQNGGIVPFLIEISTAQIYEPTGKAVNEQGKAKPWTTIASAKNQTDNFLLQKINEGLQGVILRPSLVYGPGDIRSLMPRLCCSTVYQKENSKMEFLWSKSLHINTVHVNDVCRAIIWVANEQKLCNGKILNLSDESYTTQGTLNSIIEQIFSIKTDFAGSILSNLAKLKLEQITRDSNDYHEPIWLQICRENGVQNSPYTTYVSQELLYNNSLQIDGTGIVNLVKKGSKTPIPFNYEHPQITAQLIYESIKYAQDNNWWPQVPLTKP